MNWEEIAGLINILTVTAQDPRFVNIHAAVAKRLTEIDGEITAAGETEEEE